MVQSWVKRQPSRPAHTRGVRPDPAAARVLSVAVATSNLKEERTFHQTFELTKPEPKTKVKKVSTPKPRKPRATKPRTQTHTSVERKYLRRNYEQVRNQTAERKEFHRRRAQRIRDERKAAGLCVGCGKQSTPGQTRCEVCRDKHNQSRNPGAEDKPRRLKFTPEERIEARQEYERARAQKPERKEAARLRALKHWHERKDACLVPPE